MYFKKEFQTPGAMSLVFLLQSEKDLSVVIERIKSKPLDIDQIDLINESIQSAVSPAAISTLINSLSELESLRTLRIQGFKYHLGQSIGHLIKAISLLKNLTSITFYETYIGHPGVQILSQAFVNHPKLKHLELVDTALMGNCYDRIGELLKNNGKLSTLDISDNPIQGSDCITLLNAFRARELTPVKLTFNVASFWQENDRLRVDRLRSICGDEITSQCYGCDVDSLEYIAVSGKDYKVASMGYKATISAHKKLMLFANNQLTRFKSLNESEGNSQKYSCVDNPM